MKGLSLAIIAKDEVEHLERIARDYGKYFEEIVVAYDSKPIPEIKGIRFVEYKWINDFSHKRNFLSEHIKTPYYLRLDTDDVIINPENIESVFKKCSDNGADCIYVPYIYGRDEDGNCIAQHWRETIIKKKKELTWNKKIHENILIEDQDMFRGAKEDSFKILHLEQEGHSEESFQRNFKILFEEYQEDKEDTDPRTIAYLGRMLMGLGQWSKAIPFLETLVNKSGWDDDKYFAYTELGFCHLQLKNYSQSLASCFEAIEINPSHPDAYICMGESYIQQKKFDKAITWLSHATSKQTPDTMYVTDPSRYTVRLCINLAASHLGKGEFDKANTFFVKAKQLAPSNKWVQDNETLFTEGSENDKFIKNFLWMLCYLKEKDNKKLQSFVESVPKNMLADERIQKIRHDILPSKTWNDKSVVIFCGECWEEWADPSTMSGLGGSEEAVVYLSRELTKQGHEVTVFNNCADLEGKYRGVEYKQFYNFNPRDKYNVVIGWRGNIFKHGQIDAKKKLIWAHDVPQGDQFKESEIDSFDKIIVLSEYHKTLFPKYIPDNKFFISTNGVNIEDFKLNGVARNPHRMIYTSSYDRGIQHLLQRWDQVKSEVPDAELHIFYGWDIYDNMAKKGFRSWDFKESMVQLMKQDGVFEHGRVGHKQLIKEFNKSSLYVYPCHFQEISCISAMKAQTMECVPVVTGFAALKETVKDGIMIEGSSGDKEVMDKYVDALITNLKDPEGIEDLRNHVAEHKEEFGWDRVAKIWSEELLNV